MSERETPQTQTLAIISGRITFQLSLRPTTANENTTEIEISVHPLVRVHGAQSATPDFNTLSSSLLLSQNMHASILKTRVHRLE